MMAGNLPVVPTREALSASNRPAAASTLQRGGQSQRFFTKSQPRPAPQSFDRQRAEVQQAIQRNGQFKPINGDLSRGGVNAARPGQNSVGGASADAARGSGIPRPNPGVRMGGNSELRGGPASMDSQSWRHLGSNTGQNQTGVQNQPATRGPVSSPGNSNVRGDAGRSTNDSGGWRRFSDSPSSQRGAGGASGAMSRSPEGSAAGSGSRVPRPELRYDRDLLEMTAAGGSSRRNLEAPWKEEPGTGVPWKEGRGKIRAEFPEGLTGRAECLKIQSVRTRRAATPGLR